MSIIEKAIAWALGIANDPAHGYDQTSRWGPNYDCSSFVISAFKAAGLPLTATYTGNMKYDFLRNGFVAVTDGTLRRGDVLLHEKNHTALYLGNMQMVQAGSNERGGIIGGKSGDQTGSEIGVRSYYNYPWDVVLRYAGEERDYPSGPAGHLPSQGEAIKLPMLQMGDVGGAVLSMQTLLIHKWAISCGVDGADGDFGPNTDTALRRFQNRVRLAADGICGPASWQALIGGTNGTK